MFLCRVLSEFLSWTTVSGTLKLHQSSTCILWPQKFSFELPVVLKTDFERQSNALLRGIGYFTVREKYNLHFLDRDISHVLHENTHKKYKLDTIEI